MDKKEGSGGGVKEEVGRKESHNRQNLVLNRVHPRVVKICE